MYLTSYVKKYGQYSFKEKPFNEVDAAVLATAVYSNLEVVAPSFFDLKSKARKFKDISAFDLSIVTSGKILVLGNKKLIPAMRNSVRFGEIGIKYVYKVFDEDAANQFYACTYIIPEVGNFIAFRGTDSSVAGWKENLNLSVHKVVLSQLDGVEYLDQVSSMLDGPIYIGGHSKGGNLTLFTAIHCDPEVQKRIVHAYSFDGNGLSSPKFLSSKEYLAIKDRFTFIIPHDSIVGQIMYNNETPKVVKSKYIYVFQHDPHSWKIHRFGGGFIYTDDVTKASKIRQISLRKWLSQINDDDRVMMVNFLINLLGGVRKTIFDFLLSFKKIASFFAARKQMNKDERLRAKRCLKLLKKCTKEARIIVKNEMNSQKSK